MTQVTEDLRVLVRLRVIEIYNLFNRIYPAAELEMPDIRYDGKGTPAGFAWYSLNTVQFNAVLLNENREKFIERTVGHECAHLIAYRLFKHRGHGKPWKLVMQAIGQDPSRCHTYDVTNSRLKRAHRKKRFAYQCKCRDIQLTSIRHNRIQKGRVYHCTRCGSNLKRKEAS